MRKIFVSVLILSSFIFVPLKFVFAKFITSTKATNNTFSTALIFQTPTPKPSPSATPCGGNIDISGNGSGSNNSVSVNCSSTTIINQTNSSTVTTTIVNSVGN